MKKKEHEHIAINEQQHTLIKQIYQRVLSGEVNKQDLFKSFSAKEILELKDLGLLTSRSRYWYFTPRGYALAKVIMKEKRPFEKAIDFIRTPKRMGNN